MPEHFSQVKGSWRGIWGKAPERQTPKRVCLVSETKPVGFFLVFCFLFATLVVEKRSKKMLRNNTNKKTQRLQRSGQSACAQQPHPRLFCWQRRPGTKPQEQGPGGSYRLCKRPKDLLRRSRGRGACEQRESCRACDDDKPRMVAYSHSQTKKSMGENTS